MCSFHSVVRMNEKGNLDTVKILVVVSLFLMLLFSIALLGVMSFE